MRYGRFLNLLLAFGLGASSVAWGQRGGRGAAAAAQQAGAPAETTPTPAQSAASQATAAAAAQANAGRGRGAAAGTTVVGDTASNDFYNFNPAAAAVRPDPAVNEPPVTTHQKITVNGQSLAYTARAGFSLHMRRRA
jgi:hypothetical protein